MWGNAPPEHIDDDTDHANTSKLCYPAVKLILPLCPSLPNNSASKNLELLGLSAFGKRRVFMSSLVIVVSELFRCTFFWGGELPIVTKYRYAVKWRSFLPDPMWKCHIGDLVYTKHRHCVPQNTLWERPISNRLFFLFYNLQYSRTENESCVSEFV